MLEAAAGAAGEFLRAGQVLAAVGQGFGLLLEQAEFLQVVRRQADQVALPGDGDLQRLANPPGRVGRQAGAVADVEAVDRLHQAADGFLEQVGVAQGVMAEALGDVGGEADVGGSEAVLVVDVAVVQAADGEHVASVVVAVVADELGHRPGFERRRTGGVRREVADQHPDQFALAVPEVWRAVPVLLPGVSRSEEKIVVVGTSWLSSITGFRVRRLVLVVMVRPFTSRGGSWQVGTPSSRPDRQCAAGREGRSLVRHRNLSRPCAVACSLWSVYATTPGAEINPAIP